MRIFLRSPRAENFSEVLESVFRSAGFGRDAVRAAAAKRPARGNASGLHRLDERAEVAAPYASFESYLEQRAASRRPPTPKPTDPHSVAQELAMTPQMSTAELSRLRREFALANHPDRAAAPEREAATRRMMIANMLIDREMKRRLARRLSSS